MNSKTVALDLDHQSKIGLQILTNFVKNLTVFNYTIKLEQCIDHLLVPNQGGLGGGTPFF